MILQALVDYYEALAQKGAISRPGWGLTKVAYGLELSVDGDLRRVLPLTSPSADGKKQLPRLLELPAPAKRTVGIAANFLWDNSAYLLGFDGKGKPERAVKCFEEARALHTVLLNAQEDPFARAVCRFFTSWTPENAESDPRLTEYLPDIKKGGNLVFLFRDSFPAQNQALRHVWQQHYDAASGGATMRCLVTGDATEPALIHPSIKGVVGAQSSGAALSSFNAPAFCSYGREQNLNAPVGKYAAFAYTTALNTLLADKDHTCRFGDTTVVFWSQDAEPAYQTAFAVFLGGGDKENKLSAADLQGYMNALSKGLPANWDGIPLRPDNRFYILGLAPNAARLSVRFFLQNSFGDFVRHLRQHYEDIDIAADHRSAGPIPLWRLLRETVNPNSNDKAASPQMAGDTLRAILTGTRYPATLYQQTQLRIRATADNGDKGVYKITRGKMGIVKAYLLRTVNNQEYREVLTVELNENTNYQPYVLGRLFAVLEAIQQLANPGINTTIKDKYFSAAGATPAIVFPILLNLAEKHLKKLEGGLPVYYAKQINELASRITETYPTHHNLYDQGIFQLGYYHQTQKRYQKKEDN